MIIIIIIIIIIMNNTSSSWNDPRKSNEYHDQYTGVPKDVYLNVAMPQSHIYDLDERTSPNSGADNSKI